MANSDVLVRMKADTKNYDANIAKARRTLDQFKKENLSLGGVLKQSTTALTGMAAKFMGVYAAIGAAKKVIGDMVNINKQFEQSSSNLAAVLGTSRDQITALTNQAKQLGATTQYTATQILELQANLARLGFNQNEILNSTRSVQAMATAMGADLGEAANLAGSALRGFGLNATEMERVASVLSVGTTKSALSFEKLATALPIVQTAAAKTGFTIEDTVAMLGKLTDNGINAASAATQLRKILNDSTTAGTKLANALGGPVKSFDELVVALDKAGKAGQNHADSVALVNSKNATALDILRDMAQQREVDVNGVKKQTSALQDLRDSITDCSDGMKSMQDEQLNTLQGSITILNSAWEGLMLTFGESNGVIKSVVDSLTDLLTAWTNWRKRNQGGEAAISTYELEVTDRQKQILDEVIKKKKDAGATDDAIVSDSQERVAQLKREEAEWLAIEDAAKKLPQNLEGVNSGWWSEDQKKIFNDLSSATGITGYSVGYKRTELQKMIAANRAQQEQYNYIIGSLTSSPSTNSTNTNGSGGGGLDGDDQTKLLKAQYEEQEKLNIAKLDRMHMAEADYEAQVYKIKRETLQKIADLYKDETAEKARANAAISQLDIAYQGTQIRLANKEAKPKDLNPLQEAQRKITELSTEALTADDERKEVIRQEIEGLQAQIAEYKKIQDYVQGIKKDEDKPAKEAKKLLNYSQEGIANLGSQIKSAMSKSEIGSGDYLLAADQLLDFTTFEGLLKAATERGVQPDPEWMASLFEDIKIGAGVDDSTWQALIDDINAKLAELKLPPIKLDVKTGSIENAEKDMDKLKTNVEGAIGVFGQLGGAMEQLEDPGAKVAGIIMTAIAEVAGSFAKSLMGAVGPWDWIAAAIGGVSTMIATISSIKSVTKGYASGGMVEGTSYSGDNIVARLNAGEGVLTAQGVQNAAAMADGIAGPQRVVVEGRISGKDILLSANNTNRAAGGSRGYYTKVK